jgi:hypothetical protein
MIAFGNTSPVLFRLPACRFLLQCGHCPIKSIAHGMIPFDLHQQLPAAADYIGRKFVLNSTPGCAKISLFFTSTKSETVESYIHNVLEGSNPGGM